MGLHPAIDPTARDPLARIAGFGPGVQLMTPEGEIPVEWLATGDRLVTRDDGAQPVLWLGRRRIGGQRLAHAPCLRPVEIAAGALGGGHPRHPTRLAPATRVLLSGWEVELYAGAEEALAEIAHLDDAARVHVPPCVEGTHFTYVLLPGHALVQANGLWVETLLLDRTVLHQFAEEIPRGLLRSPEVISGHAAAARLFLADWEVTAIRGEGPPDVVSGLIRHVA